MKVIDAEEFLKLNNAERARIIKEIIIGQVKFVGGSASEKESSKKFCL